MDRRRFLQLGACSILTFTASKYVFATPVADREI